MVGTGPSNFALRPFRIDRETEFSMARVADQMLGAKKQLAAVRSDGDKNFYESKCATLDRQIDNLVYELYDLTDDEIAIVEGATQKAR